MKRNVANQEVTRVLFDVNGAAVTTGTTTVYVRKDTTDVGSIGTATYSAVSLTWYIDTGVAGNTDGERITFTWDNSLAVRVQDVYVTNYPQTGNSYSIVNSEVYGNAVIKGYVDDIGVAGAGLTALGDTRIANLDVAVSTRNSVVPDAAGTAAALHAITDALVVPAAIRADLGLASANLDTQLAVIVADTNELQTDWADGGRLDLILDAVGVGVGTGLAAIAYTTDSDALVIMTTDLAGNNKIHSGRANDLGVVTFYPNLSSGTTVYLWRYKAGVEYVNPDVEVIP